MRQLQEENKNNKFTTNYLRPFESTPGAKSEG
jgi:hypothetical protein